MRLGGGEGLAWWDKEDHGKAASSLIRYIEAEFSWKPG